MRPLSAPAVAAALLLASGACGPGSSPPEPANRLVVAASVYPLYDFSREVAGTQAEVIALVPPGVEPHDWEPSAQDLLVLGRARLLVYNGAGLEPWVDRLVREVLPRGARAVNTTEAVPLLRASGAAGGPASVPGRGGSARQVAESAAPPDPHVWLDPRIARRQVETIRAALAAVDPEGAPGYGERAAAFIGRLDALDAAFEAGLRDCARREIVTSHAAFAYLARRYRLTQVAITGLTPGMEPSPSDLAALARFARHHGVTHVFFETLVSPRLAQTLAREVGAASLVLNPLEGLTREEAAAGKGYLAVMEDNLRHLRLALGCR